MARVAATEPQPAQAAARRGRMMGLEHSELVDRHVLIACQPMTSLQHAPFCDTDCFVDAHAQQECSLARSKRQASTLRALADLICAFRKARSGACSRLCCITRGAAA